MSRSFLVLSLALTLLAGLPLAAADLDLNRPEPAGESWEAEALEAQKTALIFEVMKAHQERSGRTFDKAWAATMKELLSDRSLDELETMRVEGVAAAGGGGPVLSTQLDLAFTPLETPCRFYDSRNTAAGRLTPGGGDRSIRVRGSIPQGQGGALNCGVPDTALAIVVNILSVDPQSRGNFQMWASDGNPGDSVINYGGPALGINLINGVMVPVCDVFQGLCGSDLMLRTNFGAAHAVVNVTGYFSFPLARSLECVTRSQTETIGGSFNFTSPACPSGYSLTGGGHNWTTNTQDVWFWEVSPEDDRYRCRGINQNANDSQITCYARCCRVPGLTFKL